MTENVQQYINQVALARTEIKNLRQQISALKHEHNKEIKCFKNLLDGLRCTSCAEKATTLVPNEPVQQATHHQNDKGISFRPIGVLRTSFISKRIMPRQPTMLGDAKGILELDLSVFTNPEHAFNGLEEFSHMWILFHFHAIDSSRTPVKVAPPRLHGEKRGVFSTRSPNRPCPIGLSLVKITKIEGNQIHFLGIDMMNNTPVLDVKPYIPQYDDPKFIADVGTSPQKEGADDVLEASTAMKKDDDDGSISSRVTVPIGGGDTGSVAGSPSKAVEKVPESQAASLEAKQDIERGAPDGQENLALWYRHREFKIKVPSWISNPAYRVFRVTFTCEAFEHLKELIGDRAEAFKKTIQVLLSEDPRTNYVRTRYPDHEFNCVWEDISLSCLFDDEALFCTIIEVRNAEEMQQT